MKSDPRRRLKLQAAIISVDVFSRTISVGDADHPPRGPFGRSGSQRAGQLRRGAAFRENLQRLRSGRTDLQSYETYAGPK